MRVRVAVLEGRVNELLLKLGAHDGTTHGRADGDGRHVNHHIEEGTFGSDWGYRYPGLHGPRGFQSS